jgi:hypothetical protein
MYDQLITHSLTTVGIWGQAWNSDYKYLGGIYGIYFQPFLGLISWDLAEWGQEQVTI